MYEYVWSATYTTYKASICSKEAIFIQQATKMMFTMVKTDVWPHTHRPDIDWCQVVTNGKSMGSSYSHDRVINFKELVGDDKLRTRWSTGAYVTGSNVGIPPHTSAASPGHSVWGMPVQKFVLSQWNCSQPSWTNFAQQWGYLHTVPPGKQSRNLFCQEETNARRFYRLHDCLIVLRE